MASNQTLIEKADLSVSNLTSGGKLYPKQAKEFMELLILEAVLMSMVTMVPMAGPTYEISKMGFTGQVLRPGTESTALPLADRSKPDLDKVLLETTEYVAEARIPYNVLEDNIANGTFNDYVMRLLAKALSRDLETLIINGDTTSSNTLLKSKDGILKQLTSLVVNAGGVRLTKNVLKTMLQTMPSQYLRAQKNLAFLTSKNAAIDYADSLSNRQTPLGDKALIEAAMAEYSGYPVIPIPIFPENLGGGTNMTNVVLCDPKNIHVGIQREIRIETDKDISAREYIVVATVRMDVKWAHEPASVKSTNILASPG